MKSFSPSVFSEALHRCHDYRALIQGWKKAAKKMGVKLQPYSNYDGETLYYLSNGCPESSKDFSLYLSAGIHGDEPAGPTALLRWAECHVKELKKIHYLIFPCLNPWGIKNNFRYDSKGNDLNRFFKAGVKLVPFVAWRRLLKQFRFDAALMLHEDYDAQGVYLYELDRTGDRWGADLIQAVQSWIVPEPRRRVDGRRCKDGLIQPVIDLKRLNLHPEAIYLYFHHTDRSITIETPSEFSLARRVEAQVAMIQKAVQRLIQRR